MTPSEIDAVLEVTKLLLFTLMGVCIGVVAMLAVPARDDSGG